MLHLQIEAWSFTDPPETTVACETMIKPALEGLEVRRNAEKHQGARSTLWPPNNMGFIHASLAEGLEIRGVLSGRQWELYPHMAGHSQNIPSQKYSNHYIYETDMADDTAAQAAKISWMEERGQFVVLAVQCRITRRQNMRPNHHRNGSRAQWISGAIDLERA
ncbi:uncharacterized protein TRIVIDRAFT_203723 [Trichoderma virens Gv29-8]|uniref:Uncharacterized protein n=1 Tax=Hypocrea virens (strain Gv29-8 / FGSC 10586) TaxID=413071 RepID=G9N1J0_HYPVG|nr:uncharacterized protein TRIVIDRAFT_203723 [Trichoderma virens Gv29-8]EHK19620.1 hypothetical protein TRIVIDRAFT_203723 [Trichoderma virens Gv29-8]UKZ58124.1 hypothetical protein TrVGV298_011989 [Trichoderma virens]